MIHALLAKSILYDAALWFLMGALLVFFVVFIFRQRRQGKVLKYELEQLDKLKENDVESEFVLRAMKLTTWHLNAKTMVISFDYDFRDKGKSVSPFNDGDDLNVTKNLLHPQDEARVHQALTDLCQGRTEEYHQEYRVMVPNSNLFNWEESFATVVERDVEGKPLRVVGTTMQIDHRKAMENALIEARNRAEESDRMKTAFIANISHEIRTPLNGIVGSANLLTDIGSEQERLELIGMINENSQKLLGLIDDVVSISKVESGQEPPTIADFDLNQLLADLVERFTSKMPAGVKLVTQYACESLPMSTDYSRLSDIVRHLLSNAAKFTSQGSVTVGFDAPKNGWVDIWVQDTGKGIAPENQQRIFDRFFKVDEFVPGAGLGLSLCSMLVSSLGGRITVDSVVGQGSKFVVNLPVG